MNNFLIYRSRIDLATAKSEALFTFYTLLKQSIKSCNAKEITVNTTRTVKKQQQ